MHRRTFRWLRRLAASTVAIAALSVLVLVGPASAHDPIFLTDEQVDPESGPYLPDGTISFAIYGSLLAPGETRGLEFDLRDGDELYLSLLIPDLAPETELADDDLPRLILRQPDGTERTITADVRSPFADPFSGTNYLTLYETQEPAAGGRYQIVVTGDAPTRFTVAVGFKEEFFTPTERAVDRPSSFPAIAGPLNEWYTTPADGSAPVNAEDAAGEVDIDEDLIEEELANLEEAENAAADGENNDGEGDSDASAADADTGSGTEDGDADADTADEADEAALGADGDDEGGGATWVVPLALVAAVVGGGVFYWRRRQPAP